MKNECRCEQKGYVRISELSLGQKKRTKEGRKNKWVKYRLVGEATGRVYKCAKSCNKFPFFFIGSVNFTMNLHIHLLVGLLVVDWSACLS